MGLARRDTNFWRFQFADYCSCSCTSGICDDTCSSIIIAMRRSNWKKVAVFFPSSTLDTFGTYFCRNCAVAMSMPNHCRINNKRLVVGQFPPIISIFLNKAELLVVDRNQLRHVLVVNWPEL